MTGLSWAQKGHGRKTGLCMGNGGVRVAYFLDCPDAVLRRGPSVVDPSCRMIWLCWREVLLTAPVGIPDHASRGRELAQLPLAIIGVTATKVSRTVSRFGVHKNVVLDKSIRYTTTTDYRS